MIFKHYTPLVLCLLLLSGCASSPFDGWSRLDASSKTEQVNFPALQTEMTRALGDTLAEKGYKSSVPSIELKSDWIMKSETLGTPAYIIPAGKEGSLATIWTNDLTGERLDCYAIEYGYPYHWNYTKLGVNYDLKGALCEQSDGSFTSALSVFLPQDLPWNTISANSEVLRKFTKISVADPSYVQQIIYNGRVGNSLKFIYREFSGDYIRPAFTQEIQYDLSLSTTIGFKSLKLEVLEATNTEIKYRLLKNF